MLKQYGFLLFFVFVIFPGIKTTAQVFTHRDDALLLVARDMKGVARVVYEGSEKRKSQFAMYVEDSRMVYVTASLGDTTYTIIPYEAIDFADTARLPNRYLNLYTAFGTFTVYRSKGDTYYTSHVKIPMHDTAWFNTLRLMLAFEYLGRPTTPDTVKRSFSNPSFFRLRGYQQFPKYPLLDSMGNETLLTDAIKKANKPAVIFTWAEWCPPCIRLFDSLVQNGINKTFSLVLIKKGTKEDMGKKFRLHRDFKWWPQTLFLFDPKSATDTLDNGSVPLILFTDASGNIIREHSGFDMSTTTISNMLTAIKQQKLKPGPRYYSFFDQPVISEAEARFKYTIERKAGRVRLNVYFRKLEQFVLRGSLDYIMNDKGELQPLN